MLLLLLLLRARDLLVSSLCYACLLTSQPDLLAAWSLPRCSALGQASARLRGAQEKAADARAAANGSAGGSAAAAPTAQSRHSLLSEAFRAPPGERGRDGDSPRAGVSAAAVASATASAETQQHRKRTRAATLRQRTRGPRLSQAGASMLEIMLTMLEKSDEVYATSCGLCRHRCFFLRLPRARVLRLPCAKRTPCCTNFFLCQLARHSPRPPQHAHTHTQTQTHDTRARARLGSVCAAFSIPIARDASLAAARAVPAARRGYG